MMAGLEKQLENIGENAMKGFVKGFNSKSAELNKSAKQLKKTLVSSIKKELGIHSPSKVMDREAGVFIIPGLTKGIERKLPALQQMMQRVRENVVNPMKNAATMANLDVVARGARSIEKAQHHDKYIQLLPDEQQPESVKSVGYLQTVKEFTGRCKQCLNLAYKTTKARHWN